MNPSGSQTNTTCDGVSVGEPYRELRVHLDGQLVGMQPIAYTMYTVRMGCAWGAHGACMGRQRGVHGALHGRAWCLGRVGRGRKRMLVVKRLPLAVNANRAAPLLSPPPPACAHVIEKT